MQCSIVSELHPLITSSRRSVLKKTDDVIDPFTIVQMRRDSMVGGELETDLEIGVIFRTLKIRREGFVGNATHYWQCFE